MLRKVTYSVALVFLITANGTVVAFQDSVIASVIQLFAIPALALWVLLMIAEKRVRRLEVFHWAFLLFIAWNATSVLWTYDLASSFERLRHYADYLLAIILFWNMFRNAVEVEAAMQAYVVGAWVAVFGTLFSYFRGDAFYASEARYSGDFHPDDLGLIVALAIPIAWYLGHSSKYLKPYWRLVNFAYPFAAAATIVLSGTRGALVAVAPALLYVCWSMTKFPLRMRMFVVVLAVLALLMLSRMDLGLQLSRLASTGSSVLGASSGDRMNGRLDVWSAGWDVFTKNPFLGVGTGAFPMATVSYGLPSAPGHIGIIAHNSYLSVLTETGLVGFVMFLVILGSVFLAIRKCSPSMRSALWSTVTVWLIGAGNLSFEFRWQTWLVFMLVIGAAKASPVVGFEGKARRAIPPASIGEARQVA